MLLPEGPRVPFLNRRPWKDVLVRARTAAFLLLGLLTAGSACGAGFLIQKELVGRDGDTLIVLPAYTYVTVTHRLGEYAQLSYRAGDTVREVRVRQADLDAARPEEQPSGRPADPERLLRLYRERVPFDIYIDELREPPSENSTEQAPPSYRLRVKACNLFPEDLSSIRFEVQIYCDDPDAEPGNHLWQLRVLNTRPREYRTVETPVFSLETLRSAAALDAGTPQAPPKEAPATQAAPKAETEAQSEAPAEVPAPAPPQMRYAVRLFVEEVFVEQKTGVVMEIKEEEENLTSSRRVGGLSRFRLPVPPKAIHYR
jgi:hypothetical protein